MPLAFYLDKFSLVDVMQLAITLWNDTNWIEPLVLKHLLRVTKRLSNIKNDSSEIIFALHQVFVSVQCQVDLLLVLTIDQVLDHFWDDQPVLTERVLNEIKPGMVDWSRESNRQWIGFSNDGALGAMS